MLPLYLSSLYMIVEASQHDAVSVAIGDHSNRTRSVVLGSALEP